MDAIGHLKVSREARAGYERDKFRLWTDSDHDGCDARKENVVAGLAAALRAEAPTADAVALEARKAGPPWVGYCFSPG
ncbi:hypothetical protein ACWHA1_34845 [Streptomyces decoyicus]